MTIINASVVEQAIIDRLTTQIEGVEIEAFPDAPENYQLKHSAGAVLVRYTGSRFDRHEPTDVVIQDQTITIELALLMRSLRRHDAGILPMLDAVRAALTGYRIPGASALAPTKEEFVSYDQGVWQYVVTMECKTVHHEATRERGLIEYIEGEGYLQDRPAL